MKRGIIITLPRYDGVTEYLSLFSIEIEKEAKNNGILFKKLEDKKANKGEFEEIVKALDYKMLVFNGHGSEKIIAGNDDEAIIECGVNEQILKDKIVYARVCKAAALLGKECMKENKEGCFIGYNIDFQFYIDT